jgi:hypothetical protein
LRAEYQQLLQQEAGDLQFVRLLDDSNPAQATTEEN